MSIYFGYDDSGNSNNWTSFNFTDGAGTDNDSMVDVPTDFGGDEVDSGGEVRGNYATLGSSKHPDTALSNGNLTASGNVIFGHAQSTLFVNNGKWYFEAQLISQQNDTALGLGNINSSPTTTFTGETVNSVGYLSDGRFFFGGAALATYSSYTTSDIVSCAFDTATGKIWIAKNNTWQNSGNPEAGTGQVHTVSWTEFGALARTVGQGSINFNFGQRAFAYDPPAGFKSLNTKNMNEQSPFVSGPDLVWTKSRSFVNNHHIFDSVRGPALSLKSNTTGAEDVRSTTLQSFNSNGFSLGSGADVNQAGSTFVAWCWNAGSRTIGNQDGTITSTVRANPENGFSISSYRSPATGSYTFGHGLSATPAFFMLKERGAASNWIVWHKFYGSSTNQGLYLNSGTASFVAGSTWLTGINSTTIGITQGQVTSNSHDHVVYSFAEVEGYSKFGSYVGNGSADGPFVYTGFRPRWIMWKSLAGSDGWYIVDTSRSPYNQTINALRANSSNTESGESVGDFLSNGFKIRIGANGNFNASGTTYVYVAFAEQPFKHALAR